MNEQAQPLRKRANGPETQRCKLKTRTVASRRGGRHRPRR
ncbi:hypothetical protein XOC_3872 [Xanthomonas oryzae pv. oryzicola BLS256]|uniref:Uncharacterized protein n=1 Tax=Xanthomonas oryzae pv. oryzicola (strain BLS256) TaxID=383407 RepID=G7TH21_XANOB|nr:hypothetical protein XOC_3872 [Xanthomonas oryzae pv. oryzicola BLS256]QEO95862.1 hypothetical protein XOCgx_0868 [Xanthomonas oryzae pv. oryzicola]